MGGKSFILFLVGMIICLAPAAAAAIGGSPPTISPAVETWGVFSNLDVAETGRFFDRGGDGFEDVQGATSLEAGFSVVDLKGAANRCQCSGHYHDTFLAGWDSRFEIPVGIRFLNGIPFGIGERIIILQGCGGTSFFPASVAIPVDRDAREIHFLGNVACWSAREEPLMGVYIIRFGDGTSRTVDLTRDVTIDEWLLSVKPHSSSKTTTVLTGSTGGSWRGGTETWHLDLLSVDLGKRKHVTEIEFRDAGTGAAPVLVAVTLGTTGIGRPLFNPMRGVLELNRRPVGKLSWPRNSWFQWLGSGSNVGWRKPNEIRHSIKKNTMSVIAMEP